VVWRPFHKLADFHVLTLAHLTETEAGYARFNAQYLAAAAVGTLDRTDTD